MTAEQVRDVLEESRWSRTSQYELPIALGVYAAMPLADIRALEWSNVDWRRKVIRRPREKTGTRRTITIVPTLLEILKRSRAISGPLCRDLPHSDSAFTSTLRRICDRAGVPRAPRGYNGWHRLRHTCGALLSQLGADVDTVGAIMGHEKGSPVTQRYMHTSEAVKRRMLEALDREVRGGA